MTSIDDVPFCHFCPALSHPFSQFLVILLLCATLINRFKEIKSISYVVKFPNRIPMLAAHLQRTRILRTTCSHRARRGMDRHLHKKIVSGGTHKSQMCLQPSFYEQVNGRAKKAVSLASSDCPVNDVFLDMAEVTNISHLLRRRKVWQSYWQICTA